MLENVRVIQTIGFDLHTQSNLIIGVLTKRDLKEGVIHVAYPHYIVPTYQIVGDEENPTIGPLIEYGFEPYLDPFIESCTLVPTSRIFYITALASINKPREDLARNYESYLNTVNHFWWKLIEGETKETMH